MSDSVAQLRAKLNICLREYYNCQTTHINGALALLSGGNPTDVIPYENIDTKVKNIVNGVLKILSPSVIEPIINNNYNIFLRIFYMCRKKYMIARTFAINKALKKDRAARGFLTNKQYNGWLKNRRQLSFNDLAIKEYPL